MRGMTWARRLASLLWVAAVLGACTDVSAPDEPQIVSSIELSASQLRFSSVGSTLQVQARALDAQGREVPGIVFSYTSESETVASAASGGVTSRGNGSTRIRVEVDQDESAAVAVGYIDAGAFAVINVTVEQVPASIQISPSSLTFWAVGEGVQVSAVQVDAEGTPLQGGEPLRWTFRDAGIIEVSAEGVVTSVGDGETELVANFGGNRVAIAVRSSVAFQYGGCVSSNLSRLREQIGEADAAGRPCDAEAMIVTRTSTGGDR